MPLKTFWNSLMGRGRETGSRSEEPTSTPNPSAVAPVKLSRGSVPVLVDARKSEKTPEKVPAKRSVLSMLARGGPHDALTRKLSELSPKRIAEIGVGDGSRTAAILAHFASADGQAGTDSLVHVVIDQFEMVDGGLPLRDFHHQLAGLSLRPTIVPESIHRGLETMAHRIGRADVVLIGSTLTDVDREDVATKIMKVMHAATVILREKDGKWIEIRPTDLQIPSIAKAA